MAFFLSCEYSCEDEYSRVALSVIERMVFLERAHQKNRSTIRRFFIDACSCPREFIQIESFDSISTNLASFRPRKICDLIAEVLLGIVLLSLLNVDGKIYLPIITLDLWILSTYFHTLSLLKIHFTSIHSLHIYIYIYKKSCHLIQLTHLERTNNFANPQSTQVSSSCCFEDQVPLTIQIPDQANVYCFPAVKIRQFTRWSMKYFLKTVKPSTLILHKNYVHTSKEE